MTKQLSQQEFIDRAQLIHGNTWSYDSTIYTGCESMISIGCRVHGEFKQRAADHMYGGHGCQKCKAVATAFRRNDLARRTFIQKSEIIHGTVYNYSTSQYINAVKLITIECSIHGSFLISPTKHLAGGGCQQCGYIRLGNQKRKSNDQFIRDAQQIHGDCYLYDHLQYHKDNEKVLITCQIHGNFKITPSGLLRGSGCIRCNSRASKGERAIMSWLATNGVEYEKEKVYSDLIGTTLNSRLRFDFYLPLLNILIEYDGEQHYRPIPMRGRSSMVEAEHMFRRTQTNDQLKTAYAKEKQIKLVRIPYTSFMDLDTILTDTIIYMDQVQ